MWADTLFALERGHLLRLAIWGGTSAVVGAVLLIALRFRAVRAPLVRHFALQTAAWGAVDVALVLWSQRTLSMRDFASAQHLINMLWLNTGLDAGYVGIGATLALAAWRWGARVAGDSGDNGRGGIGAGIGVLVQGTALLLLDLRLILLIGPMQ